jgi:hypothetical protein
MHGWLPWLQWPAMMVAVVGSWYVGNRSRTDRHHGFIVLVSSNLLWIAWGVADKAWALVIMQIFFIVVNSRGYVESRRSEAPT